MRSIRTYLQFVLYKVHSDVILGVNLSFVKYIMTDKVKAGTPVPIFAFNYLPSLLTPSLCV